MKNESPNLFLLNGNTSFYDYSNITPTADSVNIISTPKVRNRLKINLSGLCGLATTIIHPDVLPDINLENLKYILNFSNNVNHHIGLPSTDSLIVRTSIPSFFSAFKIRKAELSEPALLVTNISDNPKYKLMERQNKPSVINGVDSFKSIVPRGTFLMAHDDNYDLQTSGVHGAICDQKGGAELFLRTGSLQARNMGDSQSKYPTIRINAQNYNDLFSVHPTQGVYAVENNNKYDTSRFSLSTQNCTTSDAINLINTLHTDREIIRTAHSRVQNLFGSESSSEFRIYTQSGGWIGQRLHVLDVN